MNVNVPISYHDKMVVRFIADGLTLEKMAKKLKENNKTMGTQVYMLRKKLGCPNSAALVAYFLRNKLIE